MNRIKECRINSKLSQKFVAVTLGVAAPSVSNWESGKTQPTPENLRRLASLFGVTVDYLLGDEPMPAEEIKKQPTAQGDELDERVRNLISRLNEQNTEKMIDYAELLLSSQEK